MPTTLAHRLQGLTDAPLPPPHLGLSWRSAQETDLWQIRELIHLTEAEAAPARPSSEGDIDILTNALEGNSHHDCLVGLDSQARLQAFASVTIYPEEKTQARADLFAVTHKHWRGRGIGRSLLAWQDIRARQLILDVYGPEATVPLRIRNIVDENASDRRMLYAAAGFSCFRTIKVFRHHLDPKRILPYRFGKTNLLDARGLNAKQWERVRELHLRNSLCQGASEEDALRWWKRCQNHLEADLSFVAFDPETDQVQAYALTVLRVVMSQRENVSTPAAGATRQTLVTSPQVSIELLGDNTVSSPAVPKTAAADPALPAALLPSADLSCAPLLPDQKAIENSQLLEVTNAVLREARNAGYSTVVGEDNDPNQGILGQLLLNSGFEPIGGRMIYTVDL